MSEQAKPTPGPWTWRETTSPGSSIGDLYLTDVRLGGGEGGHLRVLAADAVDAVDARLIAAAPDLLVACGLGLKLGEIAVRLGLAGFSKRDEDGIVRDHVDLKVIRAAIAKATGA